MKPICALLIAGLALSAPIAGHAQQRGFGRSGGGPAGGGWRGSSSDSAAPSDTPSRWSGSGRSAAQSAPASGGYRGAGYPGYRDAAPYRGDRFGYRYPAYLGALDLGFALGFSLAYPWYYDGPWGYGYYGSAYEYGPGEYPPPYDDPFARDYGSAPPPATAQARNDDSATCGAWVWNPDASRYDWNTSSCRQATP